MVGLVTPSTDYHSSHSQIGGLTHQSLHHQANASSPQITRAARLGATRARQLLRLSIPTCRLSTIVTHMRLGTKNVVPARYGASLHKITVPFLNTQKDFTHSSRCALRQWPPDGLPRRKPLAAQYQLLRRGSTAPYGSRPNGKFNCFPKCPITV